MNPPRPSTYRTIWISDIHLGTPACQAERLLDFLRHHDSQYLYLVGDVFDGWRLKRGWFWKQSFNDVVQKILRRARKGCRVTYIPGNHDSFARDYDALHLGGIVIRTRAEHRTVDGRRLLVLHGDEFDGVVTTAAWLAHLGSVLYDFTIKMNRGFNAIRGRLGYPYWSLSAWLKHSVKNALMFIDRFDEAVAREAKRHGVDGVVCGHIHRAAIRDLHGVKYYNTGDWVESCTALVEHVDGSMEIIEWPEPDRAAEPDQPDTTFALPPLSISAALQEPCFARDDTTCETRI
jgi:UDP-2,3-diacylglucosamine pyrophosphatase LpxH